MYMSVASTNWPNLLHTIPIITSDTNMAENNEIEAIKAPELPLQKFYDAELEEVPEKAKKLLQEYSKIPPDEVLPHVLEVVRVS